MDKKLMITGALLCGLAVVIGAFGAHAFKSILMANDRMGTFDTASQYHFIHSLTILFLSVSKLKKAKLIAFLFGGGLLLFSGSLYVLALTNQLMLGAVAPIGGLLFIAGWIALAIEAYRAG